MLLTEASGSGAYCSIRLKHVLKDGSFLFWVAQTFQASSVSGAQTNMIQIDFAKRVTIHLAREAAQQPRIFCAVAATHAAICHDPREKEASAHVGRAGHALLSTDEVRHGRTKEDSRPPQRPSAASATSDSIRW